MYSSSSVYGAMMVTYIVAGVIGLIAGIAFGYFSGKIASKKGYSFGGFFALGFFLGVIGLVIALVISDKTAPVIPLRTEGADDLIKYKSLLDQGVITQEEFDAKKQFIMSGNPASSASPSTATNAFVDPNPASATVPTQYGSSLNAAPNSNSDNPGRAKTMKTVFIALLAIAGIIIIISYGMTISNFSRAASMGNQINLAPTFWLGLIATIGAFVCLLIALFMGKKELGIAGAAFGAVKFFLSLSGIINLLQIAAQHSIDVSGSIASSVFLGLVPSICLIAAGVIAFIACKEGFFGRPNMVVTNQSNGL